jgi:hypothetical protein
MADLVRGKYPVTHPIFSGLGQTALTAATQPNIGARTNASWAGLYGLTDAAAIVTTGIMASIPVPVEIGDVITSISFAVGATAGATLTQSITALFSGVPTTPALLAQSASNVTADGGFTASGLRTFTLQTPVTITAANAPNGFVYAGYSVTGTTMPTLASFGSAAAVYYQWLAAQPLRGVAAVTHGSALGATAPATIASPTVAATTPLVILR